MSIYGRSEQDQHLQRYSGDMNLSKNSGILGYTKMGLFNTHLNPTCGSREAVCVRETVLSL